MTSRALRIYRGRSALWIAGGVGSSALGAVALVLGLPAAAILLPLVGAGVVILLTRLGLELCLLALGCTVLIPLPDGLRPALLVTIVSLLALVAAAEGRGEALSCAERTVLLGLAAIAAIATAATIQSGATGPLRSFLLAILSSIVLFVALARRVRRVGPAPLAIGIALASLCSSVIVIARLGGLPLVGSNPSSGTYAGAKSVVVSELGDVNGQALLIMLGLPILLAFALQVRIRWLLIGTAFATALTAIALFVLLSRSSLIGGAAGSAVVLLLMARLSPWRVAAIVAGAGALLWYSAQDIEILASDSSNLVERSTLWYTAIDLWAQSPLIGHGPEGWVRLTMEQVRATPPNGAGGTHNLILSGLVAGGTLAALVQVVLIVTVLSAGAIGLRHLRAVGATIPYTCLVGALGAFVAQLTRGIFEASGWPGVRTNDFQTWTGLLLVAVVVTILTASRLGPALADPGHPLETSR